MTDSHRIRVQLLLDEAAAAHAELLQRLPPEIAASLPVDAQGVTRAIDHLATVAGLSQRQRVAILKPHAVNPAVLHARVFGGSTPLSAETVVASFVDGARVRADALGVLADAIGGERLGSEVRMLLVAAPPPLEAGSHEAIMALQATYAAQERAALLLAAALDADDGP